MKRAARRATGSSRTCSAVEAAVLRASILRAASVDELTYADATTESERTDALRTLITQPVESEHEVALELLLAACEEKCDLGPIAELQNEVNGFGMQDDFVYMLDRIAELKPRT